MKNIISILIICLILPATSFADIKEAKSQCKELGFEPGTEKYADCVMKLLPEKNTKKKNQPNIDKTIKEIDKNVKKIGEDIAKSLKIEIAVKGKKLKNFFINNDLILISENGSRVYKFKEKTYEIIKNDTVIQSGSWKVHGLLKNQIRLISKNDKKKYYLKKISKKPLIYNYNKQPGSEGANKEILHIKSSSKFSDISSDVKFSSVEEKSKSDEVKVKEISNSEDQVIVSKTDNKEISNSEDQVIVSKTDNKEISNSEDQVVVSKTDNKEEKDKENIAQVEETNKTQEKLDDGIDLLSSIKTQKKSNDVNTETETTSRKKDEFQYSFKTNKETTFGNEVQKGTKGLAYLDKLLNVTNRPVDLGSFFGLNYSGAYGIYKGESINGLPDGKGKWSNCHRKRFESIVNEVNLVEELTKKYHEGIIDINEYIDEAKRNIKFVFQDFNYDKLEFELNNGDKGQPKMWTSHTCEVIVGNWKLGSLDGYAKIIYLGFPDKIPYLNNLWKDININTNYLKSPFGSNDALIWVGKFKNNVAIEDLTANIKVSKGQGILSSLDEKGNFDGAGIIIFSDGSQILTNFKNGAINLDQNIIAQINTGKNTPAFKNVEIGKFLKQSKRFYLDNKNLIYSTLEKNNFLVSEKKRTNEFQVTSSYLKQRPNINESISDIFWRNKNKNFPPSLPFWRDKSTITPFTFYRGKISDFNDTGQLIYNGKGKKIKFTGEELIYEEGDFKDGIFVKGFQLYDRGSQPRTNIVINYSYKNEKPHRHSSELYYGTLNKNGPDGKGTMIMPNGVVYIGEWKNNNFHGKGELRRYREVEYHKACANCSTKQIPSLKYSLKGEFENGIPVGKMEGYKYWGKKDDTGTIRDIVKLDISGDYIKGKLIAKAPKKKIKRPEIKGSGLKDHMVDVDKITKMSLKLGCLGHEMVNQDEFKKATIFEPYILMPCESYEEYEKVMAKAISEGSNDESGQKIKKKKETENKKTFKSGNSLFLNISKETEDSFFVEDVEVKKFKNPSKIQKVDFNLSKCQILLKRSKNTNKGDLNYGYAKYIIDIENLLVKRTRKNRESGALEEKIFAISQIFIPDVDEGPLNVSYYDAQKKNFVPQISSNEIKAFIDKYHFARTLQISTTTPTVTIAFDFKTDNTMTKYNLALADESLNIIIPLNKNKIKDDQQLKSGYVVVKRMFGMNLFAHGHGENRTATYNPMDATDMLGSKGKKIEEVCTREG